MQITAEALKTILHQPNFDRITKN